MVSILCFSTDHICHIHMRSSKLRAILVRVGVYCYIHETEMSKAKIVTHLTTTQPQGKSTWPIGHFFFWHKNSRQDCIDVRAIWKKKRTSPLFEMFCSLKRALHSPHMLVGSVKAEIQILMKGRGRGKREAIWFPFHPQLSPNHSHPMKTRTRPKARKVKVQSKQAKHLKQSRYARK